MVICGVGRCESHDAITVIIETDIRNFKSGYLIFMFGGMNFNVLT